MRPRFALFVLLFASVSVWLLLSTWLQFWSRSGFSCVPTRFVDSKSFEVCVWSDADDPVVSRSLRHTGVWQEGLAAHISAALRLFGDNASFVDVGANVGVFSLLAAALGVKRVVAVEPIAEHVEMLKESVRRNGFDAIRVVAAAASNRSGVNEMFMALGNRGGSSLLKPEGESARVQVQLARLDDVVALERIDVLKVDTEGSESCVFAGARSLLPLVCLIFLELWPRSTACGSSDELLRALASNRDVYLSMDDWRLGAAPLSVELLNGGLHDFQSIFGAQRLHDLFLVRRGCVDRPAVPAVTLPAGLLEKLTER
jgi:FkbM family methyltransferase